jgi:uncharacterized membrane protein HdeD (DUF308 family)
MALDWPHLFIAIGSIVLATAIVRLVSGIPLTAVSLEARLLWAYSLSTALVSIAALFDHFHGPAPPSAFILAFGLWAVASAVLSVLLILRHRRVSQG